jgi:hypothetical protein
VLSRVCSARLRSASCIAGDVRSFFGEILSSGYEKKGYHLGDLPFPVSEEHINSEEKATRYPQFGLKCSTTIPKLEVWAAAEKAGDRPSVLDKL